MIKSQKRTSRATLESRKLITMLSLYVGSVLVLMVVTLIQYIQ